MRNLQFLLLSGLLAACTTTNTPAPTPTPPEALPRTLEEAVAPASTFRNPQNALRDRYRHPLETLKFFGVKPDMTVVEIWPGTGWYTEILAPYLAGQGRYVAATVPPEKGEYFKKAYDGLNAWAKSHPNVKVDFAAFAPPAPTQSVEPGTADMVLTFRNVHNWMSNDGAQQAFNAFYAALKPGGVLGVVEHRQNEKASSDPKAKSGYVKTSEVIAFATKAGFKLDAQSEINANPKDTKDYPEGVWTLPPTLALKDKDKAKYLDIGESDRMTLRFVKPKS
jgi:predicted methyltransferase